MDAKPDPVIACRRGPDLGRLHKHDPARGGPGAQRIHDLAHIGRARGPVRGTTLVYAPVGDCGGWLEVAQIKISKDRWNYKRQVLSPRSASDD